MDEIQSLNRKQITPFQIIVRFFNDIISLRPSCLLFVVFWPIALLTITIAQIQRFWFIGTAHLNAAEFISDKDEQIMDLILTKSGTELSNRIKDKNDELTSIKLVELCIKQIIKTNKYINAIVASRFDLARKEAINADKMVEMDTVPIDNCSFWGVPFLVKECFELEGMPFTSGIVSRKGINGKTNAISIVQIQQSGGIVIGSTNTSEGCMWHESFNQVYGRSNNPYDFGRTSGGSSGGCGSGIASCFAPIAITSDVGGSTRIPAHYNGVFGHKPSGGLVCNDNTIPEVGNGKVNNYCQLGPMSKHAEDLWPLLRALRIPITNNNNSIPITNNTNTILEKSNSKNDIKDDSGLVDEVDISKLLIYDCRLNLGHPLLISKLSPEIDLSIGRCTDHLRSLGCEIKPLNYESSKIDGIDDIFTLLNSFQIWSSMMSKEKKEPFSITIRDGAKLFKNLLHIFIEFIKSLFCISNHTMPALLLAAAESAVNLTPKLNESNVLKGEKIKKLLNNKLKGNVVLILPNLPTPAPFHNESILRIFDISNTALFNVVELPVTAVPCGLDKNGLPIGIQIVSAYGQDHISIAVAVALQKSGIAKWVSPIPF